MVNFCPVPTWNISSDRDLPIFRRQHDNRRGFNNAPGQDSVGGADDYDWYVIPSCTAKSVLVSSGVASAVVAIVSLIYLNAQINARLSNLTIDLDSGELVVSRSRGSPVRLCHFIITSVNYSRHNSPALRWLREFRHRPRYETRESCNS